jgi:hypothetical protein
MERQRRRIESRITLRKLGGNIVNLPCYRIPHNGWTVTCFRSFMWEQFSSSSLGYTDIEL